MAYPVIPDVPTAEEIIGDPLSPTTNKVTVAQFHNADNQALPTTAYGLLSGGVTQIINGLGNLDRQKETGLDQVSNLGIVMGSQLFAQFFKTTVPTTGTLTTGAASGVITPASMVGILVGAVLILDTGANAENVVVTGLPSASTATVVPTNGAPAAPAFLHTHTPSYNVTGFLFNQERDASGENSGASGKGTAVAAEYEENGGGPPLANGTPSLLRYDREVAALGKNASNAGAGYACTSTTAGDTLITPTTPGNFKTLTAGQWIQLSGSGTVEYVRVDETYAISTAPATIPLSSPVVNTGQTTATWDTFGATGPGTNPILLTGEGLEGVILNDKTKPGFGRMWQGDPLGNGQVIQVSGTKATYSYSASALTAQTAHTDMLVLRGSASKLVKLVHFECSGAATAATGIVWFLKKHTIANTGGTGTLGATATQHDSADAAASAVINTYQTTLPTIDASATVLRSIRFDLAVLPAAQAYATDRWREDFGVNGGEPIVLRGVAQECALNLGGGTIPSGEVVDFTVVWTEE